MLPPERQRLDVFEGVGPLVPTDPVDELDELPEPHRAQPTEQTDHYSHQDHVDLFGPAHAGVETPQRLKQS
jgi:hypothetical protein